MVQNCATWHCKTICFYSILTHRGERIRERKGRCLFRLCLLAGGGEESCRFYVYSPEPEFIYPVFTKTSPIRSFSVIQNERFGLVFAKTGSIISDTELS